MEKSDYKVEEVEGRWNRDGKITIKTSKWKSDVEWRERKK